MTSPDHEREAMALGIAPSWADCRGEDEFGVFAGFVIEGVEQRMRWVAPGSYVVGSKDDDGEAYDHEKPRHTVKLTSGFWIADTPCTQALWEVVMGENPSHFRGPRRPVEQVSWRDVQEFLDVLNGRRELGASLPTEAQWEVACRAGSGEPRYGELGEVAWYEGNSDEETKAVGLKRPNEWGLYDMLANVREWCADYAFRSYEPGVTEDPTGPPSGQKRVIRGGGWGLTAGLVRAAYRDSLAPGYRSGFLGFRLVRGQQRPDGKARARDEPGGRPAPPKSAVPRRRRAFGRDASDLSRLGDELIEIRDIYLQTKRTRSRVESTYPEEPTHAYVHLVFAWGLARVGRPHAAREEVATARQLLGARLAPGPDGDPIHRALYLIYRARIDHALEGLPLGAPLSPKGPIAAREALSSIERFKYNSLVMGSRVLDPRQHVDAYESWDTKHEAPFEGLALLTDPEALAGLYDRKLVSLPSLEPRQQALVLLELFEYVEALPESLALPRVLAAVRHIAAVPLEARPRLLRNALLIGGYYDRGEVIGEVLSSLAQSDAELTEKLPADYVELLSRCAPVLRRANFEAQLVARLNRLERRVSEDQELAGVLARLQVAGALASLGQGERVQTAFDAAYALLPELGSGSGSHDNLLQETAIALSRSSIELAIPGARLLLEFLPHTTDSMSINTHGCRAVIRLMEAVVLSLAGVS